MYVFLLLVIIPTAWNESNIMYIVYSTIDLIIYKESNVGNAVY